ncbi:MAG: peptide ABC transporter substrate-binding protein [Verrucomicrobiota bacterium]
MPKTTGTLLAIFVSMLFVACGPNSQDSATEADSSKTFIIGPGSEPKGLDPHIATDAVSFHIMNSIYDPLMRYDPRTGNIEPVSITHYTASENGKSYTFHLIKEARWSNGDPVVAADWVAGFRRALRPEVSTPYIFYFNSIINAEKYNLGEVEWEEVGIKVIDDYTFEVKMNTPKLFFITSLSQTCFYPIHRASMEPFGAETSITTDYFQADNLVGNGPFVLTEWVPDDRLVAERNPYYHNRDEMLLDKIVYRSIENNDSELRAYETGAIHKTSEIPKAKLRTFRETGREDMRADALYGTYYYRFNLNRPPLDDRRVRQALAYTIDRFEIVNFVTNGGQPVANTFVPPQIAGYTQPASFEEDIEEARRLLAEAGFPNGEGFPKLTLIYNTSEGHRAIAQAVQQMWKTHLGIDVSLLNQEWKVYLKTVEDRDYDISRAAWVGGVDPEGYLDLFRAESGNNHTGYNNPEFDRLFTAASQEPDPAKRMALFQQAEITAMADLPIAPMYHYLEFYLLNPKVTNWPNNPATSFIFNNVQFGDAQ